MNRKKTRHAGILHFLDTPDAAPAEMPAAGYGFSGAAIRRDLEELEKAGRVARIRGGARPPRGLGPRASGISLAKGLVPPDGQAPSRHRRHLFGPHRIAVIGGPAHARATRQSKATLGTPNGRAGQRAATALWPARTSQGR